MAIEAVPVALAIGVFGVIYGATAATVIGPAKAVVGSALLFSGAAQFTMVGLVDAGATDAAILAAVTALSLRHIPLAAVVLPRLDVDRRGRAALALLLLDETAGLAVASDRPARTTMLVVGVLGYLAWVAGTVAGVLGADVVGAAGLASVVFVILFVGLSAMTCRGAADVGRAATAGVGAAALLLLAPGVGALGAIAVAVVVAALGTRRGTGGQR